MPCVAHSGLSGTCLVCVVEGREAESSMGVFVAQLPLVHFREVGFFLVATLSGEASLQVQDLLLLDVSFSLMDVETPGGVMTKLTETQHHHPHDVDSRRPRRVLSTSWESSFRERVLRCLVDHSDVIGPLSARLHEASCRWQFLFASLRS